MLKQVDFNSQPQLDFDELWLQEFRLQVNKDTIKKHLIMRLKPCVTHEGKIVTDPNGEVGEINERDFDQWAIINHMQDTGASAQETVQYYAQKLVEFEGSDIISVMAMIQAGLAYIYKKQTGKSVSLDLGD